jgi:hypothetical protein
VENHQSRFLFTWEVMGDIHGIVDMMGQKSMMFPYGYGSIPIFLPFLVG